MNITSHLDAASRNDRSEGKPSRTNEHRPTRRGAIGRISGLVAAAVAPRVLSARSLAPVAKRYPVSSAVIGLGDRGTFLARQLENRTDLLAVCDVDAARSGRFAEKRRVDVVRDYRALLDRKDIDVVAIATPDHWHAAICVRALDSGKDVYCEKPLSLTIDEGERVVDAVKRTGRIVQVGTQQRTEFDLRYLRAVAIARSGRFGRITQAHVAAGRGPGGGPFPSDPVPKQLDWDAWLGPAPLVPYVRERCHGSYRWWYEYAGGVFTDRACHDVDIAHWALGLDQDSGVVEFEPKNIEFPRSAALGGFNTVSGAFARCRFPGGREIQIEAFPKPELTFSTSGPRVFGVQRDAFRALTPEIEEQFDADWITHEALALRGGNETDGHMDDFLQAAIARRDPASDVFTHHRALTTCHLANVAVRLGRTIRWDAARKCVIDDDGGAIAVFLRPERRAIPD